jgi:hypothetical protein
MSNKADELVVSPTTTSQAWEGPKTIEEAQSFDHGFKAGLTAYARETGDNTLKSANPLLSRLMDEQSWRTVEWFEKIANRDSA